MILYINYIIKINFIYVLTHLWCTAKQFSICKCTWHLWHILKVDLWQTLQRLATFLGWVITWWCPATCYRPSILISSPGSLFESDSSSSIGSSSSGVINKSVSNLIRNCNWEIFWRPSLLLTKTFSFQELRKYFMQKIG